MRGFRTRHKQTQLRQTLSIFTNGRVVYAIWTLIGLVNIWTIAFFFTNLLQCFPISVNWTGWGAAIDSCINTNAMFLAQAWSDVVTDGISPSLIYGKRVANLMNSPDPLPTLTMRTIPPFEHLSNR